MLLGLSTAAATPGAATPEVCSSSRRSLLDVADWTCTTELPVLCGPESYGTCVASIEECAALLGSCSSPDLVRCADGTCTSSAANCISAAASCITGIMCPDGSCEASADACGAVPGCPVDAPLRCAAGGCASDASSCATARSAKTARVVPASPPAAGRRWLAAKVRSCGGKHGIRRCSTPELGQCPAYRSRRAQSLFGRWESSRGLSVCLVWSNSSACPRLGSHLQRDGISGPSNRSKLLYSGSDVDGNASHPRRLTVGCPQPRLTRVRLPSLRDRLSASPCRPAHLQRRSRGCLTDWWRA